MSLEESLRSCTMKIVKFSVVCSLIFSGVAPLLISCSPQGKNADAKPEMTLQQRNDSLVMECLVCHSNQEAQRGPVLNGMDNWYLIDQLEKFRSGVRGQRLSNRSEYLMGIGAKKIKNDYELAYLAKWFADQTPQPAVRTVRGNLVEGKKLYDQRCASCHGEKGEGNRLAGGPSLNRLEGWYYLEQMRKFRSGERGYHSMDITGRTMAAAANGISDYNLKSIVAYSVNAFGPEEEISKREQYSPKN